MLFFITQKRISNGLVRNTALLLLFLVQGDRDDNDSNNGSNDEADDTSDCNAAHAVRRSARADYHRTMMGMRMGVGMRLRR